MGVLAALGGALVLTSMPASAQDAERIEITGSRIKRAASEGALPVTVISREQLDTSGATTVAEFVRNTTFAGAGNFRPQSGSSAQAFAGVDLRGLGSNRTLVLIDGRRVAKAPNVGDSVDMNSIPMAAVERIEILTDGASAIYGSDAIGGVVNIITRKDFDGLVLSAGITRPSIKGGDREEASALMGINSDKGHLIAGVSHTKRDIIYVRDYPWGYTKGASSYANGLYKASPDGEGGYLPNISGGGYLGAAGSCNFPDKGFYVDAGGRCRYDFNLVAADEAATSADSFFSRGTLQLTPDWAAYMNASVTRNKSFGRYAPVPDSILITPGSTFDQQHLNVGASGNPYYLVHRFAAAGNRDTSTDGNLYDVGLGVQGSIAGFDVDVGARRQVSKIVETGRGFIVKNLATAAINDGTYNVDDPFSNSSDVLKSITTTTGRDSTWTQNEVYANATKSLFKMDGGDATAYVGVESRKEKYSDIYDSLSEAGQVLGSSGNSATGERTVRAFSTELLFPITKSFEATLAGRYERYSDYGSDFSPKASIRFRATNDLTLRASVGRGFRAPSLPDLNAKPAFSADTVVDPRTCAADGGFTPAQCAEGQEFQINGLHISDPNLDSEKSKQWSAGFVWDITPDLSLTADYWRTKIDNVISSITAQEIVDRDNGDSPLPIPGGLGIKRDPVTGAILQVISGLANEGNADYAGLDVSLRFQHKHAAWGAFRHDLSVSHRLKAAVNGINELGTFGEPRQRVSLGNTWTIGGVEATLNTNYISKNGDSRGAAGGYTTHDVQVAYSPAAIKGMKISVGAQNIFEKLPALVGSPYDQKPFNYYLYDAYGRQWYGRLEQKF
ncbi:TonB-dependent receptor [Rubrivivax gelatinosus]|uniref:TonB-dependent receptor n=1 Tax=Rubrivivax gelatinosus TaxID=28068 RepID=UPI0006819ADF|nr:TonB-dependent receptor [Rubrivivax gelatinosus]MBG6078447.1 iron complex outermembrane receptor protein [Rubrivivax gelatinosus]